MGRWLLVVGLGLVLVATACDGGGGSGVADTAPHAHDGAASLDVVVGDAGLGHDVSSGVDSGADTTPSGDGAANDDVADIVDIADVPQDIHDPVIIDCWFPNEIREDVPRVGPRDELRAASLLVNGDFEEAGAEGRPEGWTCSCFEEEPADGRACFVSSDATTHGDWALVLPPGCAAFQDVLEFDDEMALALDLKARGDIEDTASLFYGALYADAGGAEMVGSFSADRGISGFWWSATNRFPIDTSGSARARVILYNATPSDLTVDDVILHQPGPNPGPEVAAVLEAEHRTKVRLEFGLEPAEVWVPLPLDHAGQVPLTLEFGVGPAEVVESVTFERQGDDNHGARVRFLAGAEADSVTIHWTSRVLVYQPTDEELPEFHAADSDPQRWTVATPVVDSAYAPLAETARELVAGLDDPLDIVAAVVGWSSSSVSSTGMPSDLSATTVFEERLASCTGYANVAAALGRAAGVPSRTVAGYLVGMAQQTHSVVEFWLGEERGWRRLEPQSPATTYPERAMVIVRNNQPEDEGEAAMAMGGRWAWAGVPLHTLVEVTEGGDRLVPMPWGFPECDVCDNTARLMSVLFGDAAAARVGFERARALWRRDYAAITEGTESPEQAATRTYSGEIDTLAVLEWWLEEMESFEPVVVLPCNGGEALCGRRFDEVVHVATHNAMSNAEDGWAMPNQNRSVWHQLEDGVRGLMLDIHEWEGDVYLCHGPCMLGNRPLVEGLADIVRFLETYPDQVVTLILENYVGWEAVQGAFEAAGALPLLHDQPLGEPWPTLDEMAAAGRTLVVLTDRDGGAFPGYLPMWQFAFDTNWDASSADELSCARNRGSEDNDLFILNHFVADPLPHVDFAAEVNDIDFLLPHAQECAAARDHLPNFLTVDYHDIGDVFEAAAALNGM